MRCTFASAIIYQHFHQLRMKGVRSKLQNISVWQETEMNGKQNQIFLPRMSGLPSSSAPVCVSEWCTPYYCNFVPESDKSQEFGLFLIKLYVFFVKKIFNAYFNGDHLVHRLGNTALLAVTVVIVVDVRTINKQLKHWKNTRLFRFISNHLHLLELLI